MSALTLLVDNQRYEGWKRVTVRGGIRQMAGAFELVCADRWAIQKLPLPILKNKPCSVLIDGTPVITGHIDAAPPRYSARGHELVIRGRDATGDLVDSCADLDGEGSMGQSLRSIAQMLCKPFGIKVSVDPAVQADADARFEYQHLQIGETVQESLLRLARIRGLLLVSDSVGGLHITRAGSTRANTPLVLGDNILEADADDDCSGRFRTYRVLAQDRESGTKGPDSSQQILAEATDKGARAPRLLIIDPTEACDDAGAQQLAAWSCAQRRAEGEGVRYTVRGWLDGKRPWRWNTIVSVNDPWARFNGDFLIADVTYTLDKEGGELAVLDVVPPDAYKPLKVQESDPTAARGGF